MYMECFELLSCFYIHKNPNQLKGFKHVLLVETFTICITKSENIYDATPIAKTVFFPGKKHSIILSSMYIIDSINTRPISNSKKNNLDFQIIARPSHQS